ncbi:unnamed protein product [Brachionus calyciflorus]|uniref:C-type lectin domain-containing protein n=1 Tax=Brachionus calyciflorus TaxID=104777 RepID=A0A814PII6_9BILA|nr:unnamed protein product [Brachionus calyciflorus]
MLVFQFQWILVLFGLDAFSSLIQVHFDTYISKYYSTESEYPINQDNDSFLFKIQALNKFLCLRMCSMNESCVYVIFLKKQCLFYPFDESFNLSSSSSKKIFEKKNFGFQEKLVSGPDQNISHVSCLNNSYYWSLNTNSCVLCQTGFIKYKEFPFSCYHNKAGLRNFIQSKSYCESMNSFLLRPKTQNERFFFIKKFTYRDFFVDSFITSLGEIYKWSDGSNVIGFDVGQPNNYYGLRNLVQDSLMILPNGYLNDASGKNNYSITICQHN